MSVGIHPQVAGVSWLERKGASALFASPPESSYDDALQNFMKVRWLSCSYSSVCHCFLSLDLQLCPQLLLFLLLPE